jgi:hypothetical protein
MRLRRREKTFGPGRCIPLDGNAKARIQAYAKAWNARHKRPGQHRGPLTRATIEVLEALLWGFHNAKSGGCFPSYETIAAKAECCRDTVYEAIKALEFAGALTWQNRLTHIRVRELDLFGKWQTRRQVIRTSNSYAFRDPQPGAEGRGRCKSENPTGTPNQEIQTLTLDQRETGAMTGPLSAGLEAALAALGGRIEERLLGKGVRCSG